MIKTVQKQRKRILHKTDSDAPLETHFGPFDHKRLLNYPHEPFDPLNPFGRTPKRLGAFEYNGQLRHFRLDNDFCNPEPTYP